MATVQSKITKKDFDLKSSTALSASVASTGLINGKVAEFVGVDKIPYRLKQGDLSLHFDITKVETSSIIRAVDGTVYVPFKKSNLQDMLIGAGSGVKSTFSNAAYLQVSAAFASQFNNIDNDILITQIVEENFSGSFDDVGKTLAAFVGVVTASYDFNTSNGVTQSYSGIDNGDGVTFSIENTSTYATHCSFLIGLNNGTSLTTTNSGNVTQSIFFTSSLHNFRNTQTLSSSITANPSQFSLPSSGSAVGSGGIININSSSASDGTYRKFFVKGRIAGDADSGSLYSFLPSRELIIYSSSAEIRSGSFQYSATSNEAATGSGVFKTLFYHSGSTGPSGSYSGSGVLNTAPLSSPLHSDAELKTTASYGYYNVPGTTIVFTVSSSTKDNGGFTVDDAMIVPRFISKSTL